MNTLDRRGFTGLVAKGTLAAITAAVLGEAGTLAFATESTRTRFDAIVIGSGFGGSVAALRLGEAGVDTLVVERGQEWPVSATERVFGSQEHVDNRMFYQRGVADWPFVPPVPLAPAPGVLEVSNEDNLTIAAAAAVGGGSIVYTGATVAPPQRYFEAVYPRGLSYQDFASIWYPRVRAALGVTPMPADVYQSRPFTHSRQWDRHNRAAGFQPEPLDSIFNWDVVRNELAGKVRPSASAGESDFGCSNGAKRSLTQSYLPAALATGKVQLRSLQEVQSIHRDSGGGYSIVVNTMDRDGRVTATVTYTCNYLFLAAGTLNTNRLLVTARETGALPELPATIGSGFGDNGDQYSGYGYLGDAGPSQGAPSASTVFCPTEFGLPLRAESWQLLGAHGMPVLITLGMTVDLDHRGTFRYDAQRKKVRLTGWSRASAQASADALAGYTRRLVDKTPGTVPVPLVWPFTLTAHPLGGCVLGTSADLDGRIRGYRGLYAMDGSLIPGTVGGANPSLTIAAVAERAMYNIITNGG